jgi:alcohol dehydrogenase, propanol-preferring
MRALVCEKFGSPLVLKEVPDPKPGPGDVVIKVLAATASKEVRTIAAGNSPFPTLTPPFIPSTFLLFTTVLM